jgi:hypothetical protein
VSAVAGARTGAGSTGLRALATLAFAFASAALPACGGGGAEPATAGAPRGPSPTSGTELERWFPLVDGHVLRYVTTRDEGGSGVLVGKVERSEATRGALRFGTRVTRFEYTAEGIRTGDGRWVLKAPLVPGASWPGENGGESRVAAVDEVVTVPAGRFAGCIRTSEQRGGDRAARFEKVFCPDVGLVVLEATDGSTVERAELAGFGPAVDLGASGTRRIE